MVNAEINYFVYIVRNSLGELGSFIIRYRAGLPFCVCLPVCFVEIDF